MIVIHGYSDNVVYVEGVKGQDLELHGDRTVVSLGSKETGGVCVVLAYNDYPMIEGRPEGHGCWSAQIVQLDDSGIPIPWPVRILHKTKGSGTVGYSVRVEIDASEDTPATIFTGWRKTPLKEYDLGSGSTS